MALLLTGYTCLVLMLFFAGLPKIKLQNAEHVILVLLFVLYLGIDMVFMPASRHRMLYDPFFVLIGGLAVGRAADRGLTVAIQKEQLSFESRS